MVTSDSGGNSSENATSGSSTANDDFLQRRISRRRAISAGAGIAAGVVGGLIIGGAAGYFAGAGSAAPKTVTSTLVETSTVVSTSVSTTVSTSVGTAGGGLKGPKGPVVWWHGPAYTGMQPAYDLLLNQDGYALTLNLVEDGNAAGDVVKTLGTSAAPDLVEFQPAFDWINYVNKGYVREVTQVWDGSEFGYDHRPDFPSSAVSQMQLSGKYFALPRQVTAGGLIYSQAAVKAAGLQTQSGSYNGTNYTGMVWPNTMDDLHSTLVAMKETGTKIPLAIGEYGGMYNWAWGMQYGMVNGWKAWNDLVTNNASSSGVPKYNDSAAIAALKNWASWIQEGLCGNPVNVNATLNIGSVGAQDMQSNIMGMASLAIEGTGLSWWPDSSTIYGAMLIPDPNKQTWGYTAIEMPLTGGPAGPTAGDEFADVFMSPNGMTVFETYSGEWPGCNKSDVSSFLSGYGSTDPNLIKYYVAELWDHEQKDGWTFPGINPSGGLPIAAIQNSTAIQGMYASNNPDVNSVANNQQTAAVQAWTAAFGSATAPPPTYTGSSSSSSTT